MNQPGFNGSRIIVIQARGGQVRSDVDECLGDECHRIAPDSSTHVMLAIATRNILVR